ncbi:MAG: lipocalin-like domain-containing protein [Nitrospinota bacterium]
MSKGERRLPFALVLACALALGGATPPGREGEAGPAPRGRAGAAGEGGWRLALPGYRFRFPRDHFAHPAFRTEWWYYTGHLEGPGQKRFGFQLTFFRSGLRPPGRDELRSRWALRNLYFAHFALSDLAARQHRYFERMSRGSLGEAGAEESKWRVWVGNWRLTGRGEEQRIEAEEGGGGVRLSLRLRPLKPLVVHGLDGISRKGEGRGRASHYYSFTRLRAEGKLRLGGRSLPVAGEAWMDHEFGSNQLADDQVGWDWFGLQLADGSELMLYLIRREDGSPDPYSSGTYIAPDGRGEHLPLAAFRVEPLGRWRSPASGGTYPMGWRVAVPDAGLRLKVLPAFESQELDTRASTRVIYWEGAVRVEGERRGTPIRGRGYVEMTGYAGRFRRRF